MFGQQLDNQLAGLSFMFDLPEGLQLRLVTVLKTVGEQGQFTAGQRLFLEGEQGSDTAFILLRGTVTIERSGDLIARVPAPALLGEMTRFEFERTPKRSATVTAAEDIEVLRVNWAKFDTTLNEYTDEKERETIQTALERYAFMHFLEQEDDL